MGVWCYRCRAATEDADDIFCWVCDRMRGDWDEEMPVTHHHLEYHFRNLLRVLSPEPRGYLIGQSVYPVYFVDTKTKKMTSEVTGRAQGAVCVYCNKQIAAWGKTHKPGKKSRWNGYAMPRVAADVIDKHAVACGEDWAWRTLAAFSTDVMMAKNQVKVGAWMKKIRKSAADGGIFTDVEREVAKMFDMLPAPMGSEKANAVELVLMTLNSLRWEPFEHGDEKHPHFFFPTNRRLTMIDVAQALKLAESEGGAANIDPTALATIGMCTCGLCGPVGREAVAVTTYRYERSDYPANFFPAGGGLG
jgi:hypothetical protein